MLELKNIKKSYTTGELTQVALNNVNLKFRESEFVSILGPSGSGKTTLLNIVGGLDRYDSGDLVINGKSTKKFKDKEEKIKAKDDEERYIMNTIQINIVNTMISLNIPKDTIKNIISSCISLVPISSDTISIIEKITGQLLADKE